jgi:ABC-type branched-subunit amino acid transport system ATPase component/branched-subunit amino acid ABC-type transport system permease component
MISHLGYLLLGTGAGAAYAALAVALVVTYRSSGVINFASGSLALYAAYMYGYLRQGLFLPLLPGLKKTYKLSFTPGFWVAALIAVALTALLGLVLYLVIFKSLRSAPPVARVVASLGVQIAIVLLIVKQLGTIQLPVSKIFPNSKLHFGRSVVESERFWFAGSVILMGVLLWALFRFTRFGLATRAAAESEKGAVVSRISANKVAALNWMLSSAVAAIAGILIAPMIAVVPNVYSLFIVPALAAAVLSRFEGLGAAIAGGFAIGMLQSEALFLKGDISWFPSKAGGPELVPLALILIFLVARGKPLPARGALIQRTLGRAPRPRYVFPTAVIALALGSIFFLALPNGEWKTAFILSVVLALISLSYVVVTGYAGQISLAQLTLAGASAHMLTFLSSTWHIPFPIAPLMSALFAAVLGTIIGIPALRVRGLTVAVVTLALAVALDAAWFRNTDIVGFEGALNVKKPKLFGIDVSMGTVRNTAHLRFGFMMLIVLTLTATGIALLRRSRLGSAMVAIRANERSAAAAGVDVVRVKLLAFGIGSFIAGLGGSMMAYYYGSIDYAQFLPLIGLALFATAYLAGITSVSGGITAGALGIGGLTYVAATKIFDLKSATASILYQLITAILLVLTVIKNPEGVTVPNHIMADKLNNWLRRRRGVQDDDSIVTGAVEPLKAQAIDISGLPTLMSIRELRVAYGGVVALDQVTVDVPEGAIIGLIGPNGAGKTTMVDALSGFANYSGSVVFDGHDLENLKPHQRVKLGLSRTFQAIELYEDLTVQENLEVGLASGRQGFGAAAKKSLDDACSVLGIERLRDRPASDLSQGQRQLVSIGRALVAQPKLLLLDEPAAGLDSAESIWLGERLRDVRAKGVTILMVDHDVNLVLGLCDYIFVLDFGLLIAKGTPSEIRNDRRVIEAYLGSTHSEAPVVEGASS